MTRLNKFDVERLMNDYDTDPIGALSAALAKVLDLRDADWPQLVAAAPLDAAVRSALLEGRQEALDSLARDLNELRTFR